MLLQIHQIHQIHLPNYISLDWNINLIGFLLNVLLQIHQIHLNDHHFYYSLWYQIKPVNMQNFQSIIQFNLHYHYIVEPIKPLQIHQKILHPHVNLNGHHLCYHFDL